MSDYVPRVSLPLTIPHAAAACSPSIVMGSDQVLVSVSSRYASLKAQSPHEWNDVNSKKAIRYSLYPPIVPPSAEKHSCFVEGHKTVAVQRLRELEVNILATTVL